MDPIKIAAVCHEANRAYCQTIGDNSQKPWEDAPIWQKDSAIHGVEFHLNALKSGLSAEPEASHNSWLAEKKAAGWKWGPVKDVGTLEHPCIMPFNRLPIEQRMKDYLFCSIVTAFWDAQQQSNLPTMDSENQGRSGQLNQQARTKQTA